MQTVDAMFNHTKEGKYSLPQTSHPKNSSSHPTCWNTSCTFSTTLNFYNLVMANTSSMDASYVGYATSTMGAWIIRYKHHYT